MATPGGALLRELREGRRRSQLWVEAEAALGTGYLQRLEAGRVARPGSATVERILDALGARYDERRTVLAAFGYAAATPLPTLADQRWAREECREILEVVDFPAYALDCANRLVAWNRFFSCLLGVGPRDPLPESLAGHSLVAPWFDPASRLAPLVAMPEQFLPALIRALRFEMRRFGDEPWYEPVVLAPLLALPRFRHYWEVVAQESELPGAGRALVPVVLDLPWAGRLQFRLAAEPFARDPRFRAIYYFPADARSMRQCAAWAEESRES
jgi:transcriptional regulator with XRE-family HTH domain